MGKSIFKNNAKNYIICEKEKEKLGVIIEDRVKNVITVASKGNCNTANNIKDIKK